ncbi:hypothetical protein PVAP13_6KG097570 [Panicum virgatum]|uniref:Uncharacterized protein n=1 Tax=Panicum virgatum TaxID=38727 RepID=A0A8T0R8X2_PANVG|nr:hypothetical protein PVAP13_6KG097570 [Panicum virgatum]
MVGRGSTPTTTNKEHSANWWPLLPMPFRSAAQPAKIGAGVVKLINNHGFKKRKPTRVPSINGREPDASERETEPSIEATGAAGDGIEVLPTRRSSVTKIKGPKKKLHLFGNISLKEKVDGMAVMKRTAECNYCEEVLCAPSKQMLFTSKGFSQGLFYSILVNIAHLLLQ